MSNIINDSMLRLSFDVTRRCNLNCKWCVRGEAENKDITKDVVDKTIDELKGIYIAQIRFFGGEPLLNAEMIEYIIDQLIENHILFDSINVFTNGTIKSEKIVRAFQKALTYFDEIEHEIESTKKALEPYTQFYMAGFDESLKDKLKNKHIHLLISGDSNANPNVQQTHEAETFYNNRIKGSFLAYNPYAQPTKYVITLEGRAEKYYSDILKHPVQAHDFDKVINKWCIVRRFADEPQKRYIEKALSVSVDGQIFIGCSMPYKRIDSESILNIKDCSHDLFNRVEEWCYAHNIPYESNNIREFYSVVRWLYDKNIPMKDVSFQDYLRLKEYDNIITAQQTIATQLHKTLPSLFHHELERLAISETCLILLEKGMDIEYINSYLKHCTDFDDSVSTANKELFERLISMGIEEDKTRRKKED